MFAAIYEYNVSKAFSTEEEATEYARDRLRHNTDERMAVVEVKRVMSCIPAEVTYVEVPLQSFIKPCEDCQEPSLPYQIS